MFTITITKKYAMKAMKDFLNAHKGQTVYFKALSDEEKPAYVLVDHFNYFRFLPPKERLERAINNTIGHYKSNYEVYDNLYERMIIKGE